MPHIADAYNTVEKISATGRQLEASALFRVARALQAVHDQWDAPGRATKLDDALKLNQRLWTFFQAELAAEDNPLPSDLKLRLLALIEFIDKRTFEAMAVPSPDKLTILIDINRNIAAGLSTAPSGVAA
jgi:flagellar protein FlaF